MPNPNLSLQQFREQLQPLMTDSKSRPFVCNGSPLSCEVFIVGFNPATEMDKPFWSYWSDTEGFDKCTFMEDYRLKRGLQEPIGVRARIERIVNRIPNLSCLETNICSKPAKTAAGLASTDRKTEIFRSLLESIRPSLVYVHSNEPIKYFRTLTGLKDFQAGSPILATVGDHQFMLLGTSGPLYQMGYDDAEKLGDQIGTLLQSQREVKSLA
ncbi:hypothetical protein [Telluribacter humicola]|uniref:hypothetical protein n=1 Tax=Telluribacter humicola TaxID=1720261 RepID=UPI001A9777AF|nr:hypothetical protein [Telluribacter humicola]